MNGMVDQSIVEWDGNRGRGWRLSPRISQDDIIQRNRSEISLEIPKLVADVEDRVTPREVSRRRIGRAMEPENEPGATGPQGLPQELACQVMSRFPLKVDGDPGSRFTPR
jgi:hypothetical protein